VPPLLREWFEAFEAGQPMLALEVGDWARLGREAAAIRHAVFTQEQGIDAALDADGADATAVHVLTRNRLGQAVGTGRLLRGERGMGRIGRMAVIAPLRGSAVGRQLLDALLQAARARGDREAMLHAQASAVGFYRRLGWQPRGEPFVEAGIEHQEMVLGLNTAA
jgi:predicted GNAT family N-acyltransferase